MATKTAQESTESLKYQTWILKVPIHCEGCRKSVKKVLQAIDGVYTTTVDSLQHKVTVTGNVDLETLIRKLLRSGKHAEVWPEPPKLADQKNKKKGMESKDGKEVPTDKSEKNAKNDGGNEVEGCAGKDEANEKDGKGLEAGNAKEGNSGGKNKRKNKKKEQKADPPVTGNELTAASEGAPATQPDSKATPALSPLTSPVNAIPSEVYPYPPMYCPSRTPVYGISYNEAYPSSTNASCHFPPMHSYAYSVPQRYSLHPSFYPMDHHVGNGNGYDYDNGSGCSIM